MSAPPRRLGRGLAAIMGGPAHSAAASAEPAAVRMLALDQLRPAANQPRRAMDETALAELTQSIRAHGILQPLLVRPLPGQPDLFQIVAGERRWRAATAAGLLELPCYVRVLPDRDTLAAALVENLQRADLDALEEADGFRRLMTEFGLTQEALAEAVGKSRSHVANVMRLLNLPEPVQAALRDGTLSAGHARALLGHPEPEAAVRRIAAEGLSVRETEALVRAAVGPSPPLRERPRKSPETTALERELSERTGLRVRITDENGHGVVHIGYRDLDQLDGIIHLLSR